MLYTDLKTKAKRQQQRLARRPGRAASSTAQPEAARMQALRRVALSQLQAELGAVAAGQVPPV